MCSPGNTDRAHRVTLKQILGFVGDLDNQEKVWTAAIGITASWRGTPAAVNLDNLHRALVGAGVRLGKDAQEALVASMAACGVPKNTFARGAYISPFFQN
ncbi:MAG: hypothetical protein U5N85_09430 [Arcicella sp.]|nr:hypothetical protein [Arcicella sp.]